MCRKLSTSLGLLFVLVAASVSQAGVCACNADVDNDGAVTVLDAVCIRDCVGGACGCCINSCDINCDGVVDDVDVAADPLTTDSMWRCQFIGNPPSACCGSCCDSLGTCSDDIWQSNCSTVDETWSQGLLCFEIVCNTVATGACCDTAFGTCTSDVTLDTCTGPNQTWTEAQACSLTTCPTPPSGACCNLGNGRCVDDVFEANCADASRVWTVSTTCDAVGCAVPPQDPCPCDGDVDGSGSVIITDLIATLECVNDDCSLCTVGCDVDCNGIVDYVDTGIAACEFRGKTDCCNEPTGACVGAMSIPNCSFTTFDGCDLLGGTYSGDGVSCPSNVPAASSWGLAALVLLLTATAVVLIQRRRPLRC